MQARRRSVFPAIAVALSLVTTTVPADSVEAEGETYLTLTPSERADFEAVSAFLLEGGRAADLPVRNLIGTMQQGLDDETLPDARRVSIDTLAEQARGSTDPMVPSLLIQACANDRLEPRPTCDPVALARRWTIADTQNQAAWLTLAGTLRSAGLADDARAAFVRGARASGWHESYDDGVRMTSAAMPRSLGPRARMAVQ